MGCGRVDRDPDRHSTAQMRPSAAELNCVANEVVEHLAQPSRIGPDLFGYIRRDEQIQVHVLGHRNWDEGVADAFEQVRDAKVKKLMGELQGNQLARVPKGFHPDQPAADLIRRKQFFYYQTLDAKLATSADLLGELMKRFKALMPVIEFLNAPLLKQRPRVIEPKKMERMID